MSPRSPHRVALSDPSTLVQIPGASRLWVEGTTCVLTYAHPCALSIPMIHGVMESFIPCVHGNDRLWNLEVLCTDARCGGRTGHILHGVNHHLGPVHQPPSSLALDRDPVGPPDGVCGERGCGPTPPRVHKLGVKRDSRAAACARCAARGACVRGTLAARPLCGSYSSCRRLSST